MAAVPLERVLALRALVDETSAIDLDAIDGDPHAFEAASAALAGQLERAIAALRALEHAELGDELAIQIGDVCFAGALELVRTHRALAAATTPGARLVAAEAAQRKLRRALRATLEAARDLGVPETLVDDASGPLLIADLTSALAVRRLYAGFRRGLRRPTGDDAEAVLVAVRYAAGALAILATDPAFADVRMSDREVLRELRDRALDWARRDRRPTTGLHLLDDMFTCGDLLRGINRRQELRVHDAALLAVLARGPDDDVGAWFRRLDALTGLDDSLDGVLERARSRDRGDALEALVPEALTLIARVQ